MRIPKTDTTAIYLSDGAVNLGLVKNPPVSRPGLQLLGFQVRSIQEIKERLKQPLGLTYRGEPPLEIQERPPGNPYKTVWLKDPDGTFVDLSEEGWEV